MPVNVSEATGVGPVGARPARRLRWPCIGAAIAALGAPLWTGCFGDPTRAVSAAPDGGAPENSTLGTSSEVAPKAAPDAPRAPGAAAGPLISDLRVVANPNNVLSATITFATNVPTTSSVLVTNTGDGGADNTFSIGPTTQPGTSHSVDVLGMRATSSFDMKVTVTDADSNVSTSTATFVTGALPAALAPITVVANDPAKTSPGFTVFTVWRWDFTPIANIDSSIAQILALDAQGHVVWYYLPKDPLPDSFPSAPERLQNGHWVFITGDGGWTEIDRMDNLVRAFNNPKSLIASHKIFAGGVLNSLRALISYGWRQLFGSKKTTDPHDTARPNGYPTSIDLALHHEITPESNDTKYLSLSTELRKIPGYAAPGGGKTTYPVVGDIIAELDVNGHVLHQWSAFDMLDPHREGNTTFFNTPFWNGRYPGAGSTKDWTHGNSVIEDLRDGTIVTSSRTQNWVYKFARNDGGVPRVVWRLGEGGDFTLTNSNETFQYGQHALSILPNGHLMMFDNGDNRPLVAGGPTVPYSRALEFSLDTTKMQATIEWQYRETPPFYSQFLGSSYLLPNGDVLVCDGGETVTSALPTDPSNLKFARIMEVTHDARPTKVLEYDIREELHSHPANPNFSGYSVYRATRIPSLY